jgi:hypothetical protein
MEPTATIISPEKLMLLVTIRRRPGRKKPIWERSDSELTPKERRKRDKSLQLVYYMRRGLSPAKASKLAGIDIAAAQKNTNAFRRTRSGWRVKKVDHVPRVRVICENGCKRIVEIRGSRTASLIGTYFNRVGRFMETRNFNLLKFLRRKTFRDSKGKLHRLETNPYFIIALMAKEPHPEFLYGHSW